MKLRALECTNARIDFNNYFLKRVNAVRLHTNAQIGRDVELKRKASSNCRQNETFRRLLLGGVGLVTCHGFDL